MKKSKVLVIGGAGYIGSHVVVALTEHGYSPVVIDNLSTGKKEHVPSDVPFEKVDILNKKALNKAFEVFKPSAVIHLAALKAAGESMEDPCPYSETNITGTINVLKQMVEHKVTHIVFSSSAATYGEPQYLPIDESHIQNPTNYYGETKLIIERMLRWYAQICDINYSALRYFNAAGHSENSQMTIVEKNPQNLIPVILEVAIGKRKKLKVFGNDYTTPDGTCVRDYIHVSDLAEAHAKSLKYLESHKDSLELNLGTGRGYSVLEVYNTACEVTNMKIPMEIVGRREGDAASAYAQFMLANKKLNWKPIYTNIHDIVNHSWQSYLRQKEKGSKKKNR